MAKVPHHSRLDLLSYLQKFHFHDDLAFDYFQDPYPVTKEFRRDEPWLIDGMRKILEEFPGLLPMCKICGEDCLGCLSKSTFLGCASGSHSLPLKMPKFTSRLCPSIYELIFLALLPELRCLIVSGIVLHENPAIKYVAPKFVSIIAKDIGARYFQSLREVYIQNDYACNLNTLQSLIKLPRLRTLAVDRLRDYGDIEAETLVKESGGSSLKHLYLFSVEVQMEKAALLLSKLNNLQSFIWVNRADKLLGLLNDTEDEASSVDQDEEDNSMDQEGTEPVMESNYEQDAANGIYEMSSKEVEAKYNWTHSDYFVDSWEDEISVREEISWNPSNLMDQIILHHKDHLKQLALMAQMAPVPFRIGEQHQVLDFRKLTKLTHLEFDTRIVMKRRGQDPLSFFNIFPSSIRVLRLIVADHFNELPDLIRGVLKMQDKFPDLRIIHIRLAEEASWHGLEEEAANRIISLQGVFEEVGIRLEVDITFWYLFSPKVEPGFGDVLFS